MRAGWKNRMDERRYFEAKFTARVERIADMRATRAQIELQNRMWAEQGRLAEQRKQDKS